MVQTCERCAPSTNVPTSPTWNPAVGLSMAKPDCGPHVKKISEEFRAQLGVSEHGGSSLKQFGWHVPQQGNSDSKLQDSSSNEDVDSLEPSQEN